MSAGQPILFALIHSPLTGPMVWQPVAHFLRALDHQVIVPDMADTAGTAKPIWSQHVAAAVSAIARAAAEQRAHGTVLVAHSGAGPF